MLKGKTDKFFIFFSFSEQTMFKAKKGKLFTRFSSLEY